MDDDVFKIRTHTGFPEEVKVGCCLRSIQRKNTVNLFNMYV